MQGDTGLSLFGERRTGQDVRSQNVTAALAIANIVKSSLGPVGLDKMLVDEVGDVVITNDGATILRQLEVKHPAAKVLVELSALQDKEVGDGTTSVVIIAAELLKHANKLVKNGIHPTSVISGYLMAKKEACKYIRDNMAMRVENLPPETILQAAKTSMSSKIIGFQEDFFAKMAVEAVTRVKTTGPDGKIKFPVKSINILKAHGKSMAESELVDGFALNCTKSAQGMPSQVRHAKIAFLDIDLRKSKMPFGVRIELTDPSKLEDIRRKEAEMTKDRINLLLKAGANVILTTLGIDDMAMKLFVENKVIGVRRVAKKDMKSIAKACGGRVIISLADMDGNESVDESALGTAEVVEEARVGDGTLLYFKGCKTSRAQTIILRGANDYLLDEVERSLHDAMSVVKRVLESSTVVAGGGAVEAGLSIFMESIADSMGSREQLAIAAFAQALLVIPKTLSVNGAHDATDLVAKLRAYHHASQTKEDKKHYRNVGLDLQTGKCRDNLKAGVLEPAMSKIKMIRFATEAAVTILRIDDAIKMHPKNDPKAPHEDDY